MPAPWGGHLFKGVLNQGITVDQLPACHRLEHNGRSPIFKMLSIIKIQGIWFKFCKALITIVKNDLILNMTTGKQEQNILELVKSQIVQLNTQKHC